VARRTRGPVRHGTRSCYVKRKCKRPECALANTRYAEQRKLRIARGQSNLVDAGPVLERLRELVEFVPIAVLATRLQCSRTTIRIYVGRVEQKQPPATVRKDFAEAVAAFIIWPLPGPNGLVLAIGSQRRIQALEYQGQTQTQIAAACGISRRNINRIANGVAKAVTPEVHKVIKTYYDRTYKWQAAKRVNRNLHSGRVLVPPGAWDDDTIDDPKATPEWGITEHTLRILGRRGKPALVVLEDLPSWTAKIRLLKSLGATADEVASWMGLERRSPIYRARLQGAGVTFLQ
jgi:hypothetical protein